MFFFPKFDTVALNKFCDKIFRFEKNSAMKSGLLSFDKSDGLTWKRREERKEGVCGDETHARRREDERIRKIADSSTLP